MHTVIVCVRKGNQTGEMHRFTIREDVKMPLITLCSKQPGVFPTPGPPFPGVEEGSS